VIESFSKCSLTLFRLTLIAIRILITKLSNNSNYVQNASLVSGIGIGKVSSILSGSMPSSLGEHLQLIVLALIHLKLSLEFSKENVLRAFL
jgi:hypothetical protein